MATWLIQKAIGGRYSELFTSSYDNPIKTLQLEESIPQRGLRVQTAWNAIANKP